MREILFRAKCKDDGEWVEGYYTQLGVDDDVDHYISQNMALVKLFENPESNKEFNDVEVDPETVCQYTSMKDANGNKIWENDIVKSGEDYGAVEWDEASFVVDFDGWRSNLDAFWGSELEVIGNKFDDPELLEDFNE